VVNSTVNGDCTELTMHHDHNIGVAMDTPKGLIVPVLKEVSRLYLAGLTRPSSLGSKHERCRHRQRALAAAGCSL
jgi:pyruvate dehydrogenase E2 component (dihydrolipoamide acetyltransferase)